MAHHFLIPLALLTSLTLALPNPTNPVIRTATDCTASSIPYPSVFGLTINSLTATPSNTTCAITITHTHAGTSSNITTWLLLPLQNWNGRFQGVGGGGYTAGSPSSLVPIAAQGYACAATDAGHTINAGSDASSWALLSPGNVNQDLLIDFAYRSYHEMTLLGKSITETFYTTPISYAYWNGCSTGGRQGLALAQRYPADYDGILADAPAVQWNDFTPAQQWPYVVMNNEGYAPSACEFKFATSQAIQACDGLDGQIDGVISAPALCGFSVESLIGRSVTCGETGQASVFSKRAANVVGKIWQGPRTPGGSGNKFLWWGPTKGTNLTTLAMTTPVNGKTVPVPFGISDSWYKDFLFMDNAANTANVSYAEFADLFLLGHLTYDSTMGTFSPDLRAFKRLGHKLLTWQGLADNYIMPQGTMHYYSLILSLDPTAHTFYRQFYSPGVGHCGGGTGVLPIDAIGALRAWVEDGVPPATLAAGSQYPVGAKSNAVVNGTNVRFLNLCPWPSVNRFRGGGRDPSLASSYACVSGNGWVDFEGEAEGSANYSCVGAPGWY